MLNKIITICLSLIFISTTMVSAFAYQFPSELSNHATALEASLKNADVAQCMERLGQIYDIKTIEFFKFLETHFQSKSDNSALINVAVAKYDLYRKDLEIAFDKIQPQNEGIASTYASYIKCGKIKDTYLKLAKDQMLRSIKTNSVQKQSTVMVEKYKALSDRLRKMNLAMAQMYGYFKTFDNKLPGFLNQCVQN
ncbi:hypothetical protein COU74_00410 [Candidatus Peregrinibacteria bacterium CG10_big_fil_rev_8_21_14_0_10_36_19]|nr:MAG: hypothetical protein COU74_00410 [Candidatus Peregrinibacteria bacterium CG10_big_fil_rev_8_21_14_0_10_36_19]